MKKIKVGETVYIIDNGPNGVTVMSGEYVRQGPAYHHVMVKGVIHRVIDKRVYLDYWKAQNRLRVERSSQ